MKRILVCDDDQDTLYFLTFALTGIGWEVFTSEDCNNIVDKVNKFNPSVIVMDNSIPDQGGIITTRILKKHARLKHIPVVFFTGHNDIASLAEEAGADFYLIKPFQINKLQKLVSEAYDLFISNTQSESQSETV